MKTPDEQPAAPAAPAAKPALGPLPPGVKLPPKAPPRKLNLPPRRTGPVLPVLDGKTARCPYCGGSCTWPPEGLKCPSCGKLIRPPHGHAPKDREKRRVAKEKIAEARDREMMKLGDRASLKVGPAGYLIAIAALVFLGAALISASKRPAAATPRKERDPAEATTNLMQIYAMALEHFRTDVGRYPDPRKELGLASLERNVAGWVEWNGPYASSARHLFQDGWGEPFVYRVKDGAPFLMSFGADRKPDTGDEIVAPTNFFRCHPDFIPRTAQLPAGAPPPEPPADRPLNVTIGGSRE